MKYLPALLMATLAVVGCNQADNPSQAPDTQNEIRPEEKTGKLIKEFQVSAETWVRFQESDGAVTFSLEGHQDEKEANKPLEDKLARAATLEAAYRVMDPVGAVPQAILDHDKRAKGVPETSAPEVPGAAGPGSLANPSSEPLAKVSDHAHPSADAHWDWAADAQWWKGVVGYECQWHEVATNTNRTWVDGWRHGWFGSGYLMAAGHTYGANAYAYIWRNGAWSLTNSRYLQPRHYIIWYSGDNSKQYRRYRVVGNGGAAARVHWGMRWDSEAPGDLGVICQS